MGRMAPVPVIPGPLRDGLPSNPKETDMAQMLTATALHETLNRLLNEELDVSTASTTSTSVGPILESLAATADVGRFSRQISADGLEIVEDLGDGSNPMVNELVDHLEGGDRSNLFLK